MARGQKIVEDKVSGTRADRPGFAQAMEMLRYGDMLVAWELDRLFFHVMVSLAEMERKLTLDLTRAGLGFPPLL